MTSIPRVLPGSQAFWHCDVVHSVESQHKGSTDSSVLYIPACPLTLTTAKYLKQQRDGFVRGVPPSDFPQGVGESGFVGRAGEKDVATREGRRVLGFEPFKEGEEETEGGKKVIREANRILFGERGKREE